MKKCFSPLKIVILSGVLPFITCTQFPFDDSLRVNFENDPGSAFAITAIHLMEIGPADEEENTTPSGKWSDNLLTDDAAVPPGESFFFIAHIPNRYKSIYRIGVTDESGNRIMLHEQQGYPSDAYQPTITHWGSGERTVGVTIDRNPENNLITIKGYSDFAGIE